MSEKYKVTFWTGDPPEMFNTRDEAVKRVKDGLSQWMNDDDFLVWRDVGSDNLPQMAIVLTYCHENTDAFAAIELVEHPRSLRTIAKEIDGNWSKIGQGVSPYAEPYLNAMYCIDKITDMYYLDTARSVVAYFLSNASHWKGKTARRIKAELKEMLDGKV